MTIRDNQIMLTLVGLVIACVLAVSFTVVFSLTDEWALLVGMLNGVFWPNALMYRFYLWEYR